MPIHFAKILWSEMEQKVLNQRQLDRGMLYVLTYTGALSHYSSTKMAAITCFMSLKGCMSIQ